MAPPKGLSVAESRKMLASLKSKAQKAATGTQHLHRPGKRPPNSAPPKQPIKRPRMRSGSGSKSESSSSSEEEASESEEDDDDEPDEGLARVNDPVKSDIELDFTNDGKADQCFGTLLLMGKKFCGKTNVLLNIGKKYKNKFDNIWIFTVTKHKNNLNELLIDDGQGDPMDCMLESLSEAFLEELIEHQVKTNARTLLLFDDFIGLKGTDLKHSSNMKKLAANGRNFNVSIIFSSQDPVEVSKIFRRNPEYVMIGDNDEDSIDLLKTQLASATVPKTIMKQKIVDVCRKDYHFLFIDKRKKLTHQVLFPLVKK